MRQEAFERLYEEHARGLLAFLVYRTGDVWLAEDILADTFERVLERGGGFDPTRGSEKTWLYSIALNRLRGLGRRAAVEARSLERVTGGAPLAAPSATELVEDRDAVRRGLARLSEEEREAVALRFGGDMSVPEIAKVTGERITTVVGRV